jgi:hypothetical protein
MERVPRDVLALIMKEVLKSRNHLSLLLTCKDWMVSFSYAFSVGYSPAQANETHEASVGCSQTHISMYNTL